MATSTEMEWDPTKFWKEQDFQQSARLHLQDWIWSYQLGYTFHPKIPVSSESQLKVADVACGNGAWLLAASRTTPHPGCEYHGFDITNTHFPNAAWLPKPISLHVWDAFGELPQEYVGAFDVVHIRTIFSAVIDNKIEPLLNNLLKMLKPGGYLQWDEQDPSTQRANAPEGVSSEALRMIVNIQAVMSQHMTKLSPDWLHKLGPTLQSHGCEVLAQEEVHPKPELSRAWADNMLTNWMGIINRVPEQAMPLPSMPGLPKELSRSIYGDLVLRASQECAQGCWPSMVQRVIVARKAA